MVVKRALASGTIIKGGIDTPSLSSPAATPNPQLITDNRHFCAINISTAPPIPYLCPQIVT